MAVSVFPALVDALVAQATTALPNVLVLDGEGNTDDPGDFLMIGTNSADGEGMVASGSSRQEKRATGPIFEETGEVNCLALSWNGDGNQKAARDAAFTIAEAVSTLCRTNTNLGVANIVWTRYGAQTTPLQIQSDDGALCIVEFTVAYQARI